MKHFNWLIKLLFYKHTEKTATALNTKNKDNYFYKVSYLDQIHANLCTNASENMLYHFAKKPTAVMSQNPRGPFSGISPSKKAFTTATVGINTLKATLRLTGPFILALPLRIVDHSVVVFGFSNNNIIYHDPLSGSNKMLSIDKLTKINGGNTDIEIATANFFNKNMLDTKRTNILPNVNQIKISSEYHRFFTLEKMQNPCDAVKFFLRDYAENSFWSKRNHKRKVLNFLKEVRKMTDLDQLYELMNKRLSSSAQETRGELLKRLKTVTAILSREEPVEKSYYHLKHS